MSACFSCLGRARTRALRGAGGNSRSRRGTTSAGRDDDGDHLARLKADARVGVPDKLQESLDGAAVGRNMVASGGLVEALAEPFVHAHFHGIRALDLSSDPEVIGGAESSVEGDLRSESLDGGLVAAVVAGAVVDQLADQLRCHLELIVVQQCLDLHRKQPACRNPRS